MFKIAACKKSHILISKVYLSNHGGLSWLDLFHFGKCDKNINVTQILVYCRFLLPNAIFLSSRHTNLENKSLSAHLDVEKEQNTFKIYSKVFKDLASHLNKSLGTPVEKQLSNTGGPRYSRTFYLQIRLFTLQKWSKMTIFKSKKDFLSAKISSPE
jgi:hypothetical protein